MDKILEMPLKVRHQISTYHLEDEREYIPEINQQGKNAGKKELSAFTKRIKKSARIVFAVGIVSMIIYSMGATSKSVDTSEDAVSALETRYYSQSIC